MPDRYVTAAPEVLARILEQIDLDELHAALDALPRVLDALDAADAAVATLTRERVAVQVRADRLERWLAGVQVNMQAAVDTLTLERDALRLDLARLRFACEHHSAACKAVPVEVWRAWRRQQGLTDYEILRNGEPGPVMLADLLARAGWTPTEGTR